MDAIKKRIPKKEWKTLAIITGDTPPDERRDIEEKYLSGKIRCLINCMVLTEGTDLPRTNVVIIARPTTNDTLYTQIVGRGCRLFEGKKECLVLDILPASKRRICSATTLAGLDWSDLSPEQKETLEEEGIDLLSLADEIAAVEAKVVTLAIQELDLFADMYNAEVNMITESLNTGNVKVLTNNITSTNTEKIERAMETDGVDDFLGMRVEIGRSDNDRYIIRGSLDNYEFHITSPDMLGKVHVKAYINNKVYATDEPIPMSTAITQIKKILVQNCEKSRWLWDENRIREWNDIPASGRQLDYAYSLAQQIPDVTVTADIDWKQQFSKYQMHALIDFLLRHQENKKHLDELQRAVEDAKDKKESAPEETKPEVTNSFKTLAATYKNVQLPPVEKYKPPEANAEVEYRPGLSQYYLYKRYASDRQMEYLMGLVTQLNARGATFDDDFSRKVQQREYNTSGDVSILIDALKWLTHNARIAFVRKPSIDMTPVCKFIEDPNARMHPSPIAIQVTYPIMQTE